ncbi:MAG TPA: copper ion binding protein [Ruminiclostridium sp.]|nr:copper ion binding protein [Ruminiclostridium sp.]
MIKKETIKIAGMSCAACAARIEKGLGRLDGVNSANVNFSVERATVEYDDDLINSEEFEKVVTKLGYSVIKEAPTKKAVLNITGMTCASCSARIEKKLSRTHGVISANVNLTTEKATIEFEPGVVRLSGLIKAVESLGYKAEKQEESTPDSEEIRRGREIKNLKLTLIAAVILSSPLVIAMILPMLEINIELLHNQWFQLAIATPVQFIIGFRFYKDFFAAYNGFYAASGYCFKLFGF